MNAIKENKNYLLLVISIVILIIPAFFLNIQELTLIPDEAIRSLVALEMKLSGDYITPTMGDVYYFKKPPVFNWIIASFFSITGNYSELATRIPMLLSLIGYALTIFYFTRKKYDTRNAFLAAVLFMITLRIILYESLFGLIDMTYSWFVFINFMLIYELFHKKKWLSLYLISYSLTALTFLMKGLPSIAFQGITLLIIFISNKELKKLFTWKHLVGTLPFWLILGAYFGAYYLKNPDQFSMLLLTLLYEATDKSAVSFGLWDIIKHIFTYSTEILYNFLPGTLLVIFLFSKKTRNFIKADSFIRYMLIVFVFNISIFLVSPTTFMRYVLPLTSLLTMVFTIVYFKNREENNSIPVKVIDTIIIVTAYVICLGQLAFPLIHGLQFVQYKWLKAATLFIILLTFLIWLHNKKQYRLELFIITILMLRLSFNFFIIPSRTHNHWQSSMRESCTKIGTELKGEKIVINDGSLVTTTHYYLTAGKQEIIPYSNEKIQDGYGIVVSDSLGYSDKNIVFQSRIAGAKGYLKIIKW